HLGPEPPMGAWVDDVEPAADDGDRRGGAAAGSESSPVGGAVHPEGEARDDPNAHRRQVVAELVGQVASVAGALTAADDRHTRSLEGAEVAGAEQHGRGFVV